MTTALGFTSSADAVTATWVDSRPVDERRERGTITGITVSAALEKPSYSTAEAITQIKVLSGLTADQIGRALGVSRRSVQNWLAGNAVASFHEESVSRLLSVISGLPAHNADERRKLLLSSRGGTSLFHQFAESQSVSPTLQALPQSVSERLAL
ncbi:helix-turn-helix domain-containing protein [Clavibacter michiganensis]|uniref:helix-turn-helix domain-containing protein n=1 Tax=Clavibacter michiganensis TaxID=28447 RepID=UPI001866A9A8|nr:helix-turn-helix domain-containing protein [Clavibacter michiganensis]MBE3079420.1 hypothetical protein [Clavibacter michiganensis subsp. michiganensis]MDO4027603.1 helix-turn-helix domain-containing protein [Clavibacter michiganensis]